ncbi:MAG TPA: UDP-glucose 4-epimerase GalE [Bacteroidales bacterium]|nr:UDP-glucose 4-epimerase GalE [Bacteroidales bacterium]
MKVLVTGGTGYIGSHTVVELQQIGFDVIVADDLSNSSIDVLDNIAKITGIKPAFEKVDLSDPAATAGLFKLHHGIGAVIHFAAFKAVGESVQLPLKYYRTNLGSLINILQNMEDHGIKNLVFSSSCTVYGQPDVLPVKESAPVMKAESPYGNTKQIGEEIIIDACKVSDLHAVLLRYFNPIGAHDSALIGELPIGRPNNLVPFITQTAIGIRKCLNVFGNDYNTPDGTPIRDYIHVVDLAKAHVTAMERMMKHHAREQVEVFNLGTGIGYSVLDVIKSFEKVSGLKLNYEIQARRAGDIVQIWADPELANKELGWKAEKGLDEMTLSSWKWEQHLASARSH